MPIRIPSAFGPIPFDKHDSVVAVALHDDFITVDEVAAFTDAAGVAVHSELAWTGSQVAGDSVANSTVVAGVADHPGIIRLSTGATTPADGDITALSLGLLAANDADGTILLDGNGVYLAAVLRIADIDAQKVEFGLAGQAPAAVNSSAADIVSLVWDPEDAAAGTDQWFLAQVNAAGTDTEAVMNDVAYVEADWVLLEIAADDESATFRVTTEDGSHTETIQPAAMPLVAMRPFLSVEAVGAAEELLDVDAFQLRYIRRVELGTSGMLGA